MGSSWNISIGQFEDFFGYKSSIMDEALAIFSPLDKKVEADDEGQIDYRYVTKVKEAKARLEILGFTYKNAVKAFNEGLVRYISDHDDEDWDDPSKNRLDFLMGVSIEKWVDEFVRCYSERYERRCQRDKNDSELSEFIFDHDLWEDSGIYSFPAHFIFLLRTILEQCNDDDEVCLDYGPLVHGGYVDADSHPIEQVFKVANNYKPSLTPIIVLTEGKTDREVLLQSLKLLHPGLSHLYRFVDFDLGALPGSVGSLVIQVKAFISAGITERIVALFDNDAAGHEGLCAIDKINLPPNVVCFKYPDLESAKRYPSLGPSGQIEEMNINGQACSLEMYLGDDCLRDVSGVLIPVQWKSYIPAVKRYQGEIDRKADIQKRFFEKLGSSNTDALQGDWAGVRLLLSSLFSAFNN